MKKYTLLVFGLILSFVLVSWGYEGHYAVAAIAENHLTPNTQLAVKNLLGHKTMADVSSYADDLRSDPAYASTKELHYLNIPLGHSYEQFSVLVKNSHTPNIYNGIAGCIFELKSPTSSRSKKEFALEMLIHLVGDAHQPMHVSRAADKGGNATSVTFLGAGTNLHSLWDSGLLDHQKINYKDLAAKYDDVTPGQIKKWQSDNIMVWLWESYQITTILYKEAEDNPKFDEKYYQDHLPILKSRIEKAGIRLAGILNDIYK
jgi:hypothetical protein